MGKSMISCPNSFCFTTLLTNDWKLLLQIVTSGVLCRRQDVPPLGLLSEARAKGSLWILLHDAAAVHGVPAFQEMVMVLAFRFLAPISISSWREDEEGGGDAGIMLLISGPSIVDSPPQNNLDGRVSNFVQHYELQSGCVT
uniref:Uncharacterized protein n=1 Tax=Oryza glaberrima TaxID=4538 RepID=I1PXM5_ORYGL